MFIYIARPKQAPRQGYIEDIRQAGWSVFDPWAAWCGGAEPAAPVPLVDLTAVAICDVILADCPEDATGTAMEIGFALALGKKILVWKGGASGAMFCHPRITYVDTLPEVIVHLRAHQQAAQGPQPDSK
jgi:nucleoside 2-deoxyribosyltransferase